MNLTYLCRNNILHVSPENGDEEATEVTSPKESNEGDDDPVDKPFPETKPERGKSVNGIQQHIRRINDSFILFNSSFVKLLSICV